MKTGGKRDWYRLITRGMGSVVCTASVLLFVYLTKIAVDHGLDLGLTGFFLVPVFTFAVGCLFFKISGWKVTLLEYKGYRGTVNYNRGKNTYFGRIEGIDELVAYEGDTMKEINASFRDAVDYYRQNHGENSEKK